MNELLAEQSGSEMFSRNRWIALAVATVSLLFLPALTYSILHHAPEYDELLHIMSARGINATGLPAIADGFYTRAELYTRLVAWMTAGKDDELLWGRLPAVFFGVVLSTLLGYYVTRRAGWLAGLGAAFVFVIAPLTLSAAVMVRFYTAHTLVVTVMLLLWFELVSYRRSVTVTALMLASSLGLLWLGMQLHELTKISLVSGLAAIVVLISYDQRDRLIRWWKAAPIVAVLLLTGITAVVLYATVTLDVISLLRGSVPLWSENKATAFSFYISALSVHLPFVWPIFPLLAVLALMDKTRLALFCLVVLGCALIINSLAAQKATRYFYHAFPMICIVWGLGLQKLAELGSTLVQNRINLRPIAAVLVVLGVLGLCLLSTNEVKRGIKLVLGREIVDESLPVLQEPDWLLARDVVNKELPSIDTVVVTSAVKGLYAFGRYDYELSATVVQETVSGEEFGLDPRTGRRVISQPESVLQIMDEPGSELFVLENRMINQIYSAPEETIALLNTSCESLDLSDTGSQLSAWVCRAEPGE